MEQARNAAVVRSLRRSENLQIREDLTKCKQRYAVTGMGAKTLLAVCLHRDSYFMCSLVRGQASKLAWYKLSGNQVFIKLRCRA